MPIRFSGPQPERDFDVREPEGAVDEVEKLEEGEDLGFDFLGRREDVGVVLRERAHARQARRHARQLVAVQPAEIGEAHRQVAVRPVLHLEDQVVAGAVHRLDAELPLLDVREKHVLAVVRVVARSLEELHVEDLGRDDLFVAAPPVFAAEHLQEAVVQDRSLRQEEGRGRRPRVKRDELELLAELAVVAGLRLLEPREVLVELLLREEAGRVDPLEHRVLLVALPVGPGGVRELEHAELAGRGHVRAAAEVDEVLLPVAGDPVVRDAPDDLDLQGVLLGVEDPDRLVLRHLEALDRVVLGDDPAHLRFDRRQVLRREGALRVEVVVVAVLDRRADADLDRRKEALDGVGRQVGRRVAIELEGLGRFRRDDRDRRVGLEARRQVHELAVDLRPQGILGEPRPDPLGDLAQGGSRRNLPRRSVGQRDRHRLRQGFHCLLLS